MRVLAILMMLAAASSAGVARKARVRGGTEARVLAEAGQPASGRILSLSVNMGNKPCVYDGTVDTTLATRAGVANLAPGVYPYTVVVLQTQESDGGDAMMDAFALALHIPQHQGAHAAWGMAAQDKGTAGFNTRQRVYYRRDAVSDVGAAHGKYVGQADHRFTAKNYLLRTLTMTNAPGGLQQSTCTLDIISTHLPMDSDEKSGARAGYTVRLNEIAELQAWRAGGGWKRNINTGAGAAILSGDLNFRTDDEGEQLLRSIRTHNHARTGAMVGWAEPDVPDYYTCRFARPSDVRKLSATELAVAELYSNPQHNSDATTLTDSIRRNTAAVVNVDQSRLSAVARLKACRAGGAWARSGAEGPTMSSAAAKANNRVYASRVEACGFDEKSRKKPFSYCDRVITRANTPDAACPYVFRVGQNGDGSYSTYASLPLCPSSDHNAILATFDYSWLPRQEAGGNAALNDAVGAGAIRWEMKLAGGTWMKSPTAKTRGEWKARTLTLSCARRVAAADPNPNPTVRISWVDKAGLEQGHGFLMFDLPEAAAPEPRGIPNPAHGQLVTENHGHRLPSPAVLCDRYGIDTPWRVSLSDSPKICIAVTRGTTKSDKELKKQMAPGTSTYWLRLLRENKADRAGALAYLNGIIEEAKLACS